MLRRRPSFLCTDACLPALVLMAFRHHCLYQISLCARVSYNTLIPFLEGRNSCSRLNSFTDFLCPDLIDGYTGERAALEEQLHQKEQLQLSLEQELQVRLRSCRKPASCRFQSTLPLTDGRSYPSYRWPAAGCMSWSRRGFRCRRSGSCCPDNRKPCGSTPGPVSYVRIWLIRMWKGNTVGLEGHPQAAFILNKSKLSSFIQQNWLTLASQLYFIKGPWIMQDVEAELAKQLQCCLLV